jgi:ABC-type branched-subunit amino acid transport system substrate-binding protein
MNNILKALVYSLFSLLVIAPFTAVSNAADTCVSASGNPIQLGAIFPREAFFTTENSEYFKGIDAMRQAVNACGGVNGRPVEWIYQPASNREDAETAARTLINENHVPLIVGSGLLAVNEGGRIAAEDLGAVYWEITEAVEPGGEWFFSIRPDNYQVGQATGRFVSDTLAVALAKPDLKTALIYENRLRGQTIAQGILDFLPIAPTLTYNYTDHLLDAGQLGVQLREDKIDVVILAAFEDDGDYLWYAAQQADANVGAWIHVGGEGYRRNICGRIGNADGLISVDASGPVNAQFRETRLGEIYEQYRRAYLADNSQEPGELADLAASGVYMLLHDVLPATNGDYSASVIRNVLRSLNNSDSLGMMGEGITFKDGNGSNQSANVLFQQAQSGAFCTLSPSDLATCMGTIQPFPTWRERALAEEKQTCNPQT